MEDSAVAVRLINEQIGEALQRELSSLAALIDGDLLTSLSDRLMYATDASAYRELPLAVCLPRHESDIVELVSFAAKNRISLVPRAAGTSLAGQVVGRGLIIDVSRYMTEVLEVNAEGRWVRVQPGVILDELNMDLKSTGLFFSPETSTSNRCMIGGMIGNNSSGLHSLIYGTTREHLHSLKMILSDGSVTEFGELDRQGFDAKCNLDTLEGAIYRNIRDILSNPENLAAIEAEYPDPGLIRRNTGYALDELASTSFFKPYSVRHEKFNFCRLLAGSEGTLGIVIEAKLNLQPLPPLEKALIPVHMNSVMDAIKGNLVALRHSASAVELMDKNILDLTAENISQRKNRFFLKDDPGAILIVEFIGNSSEELLAAARGMEQEMRSAGLGFHFPFITGKDISRVWALRKAGLGVLSKMKGDGKPVSVIEDTSVLPTKLEEYIRDFDLILQKYGLKCVYHAHISVGELHLRPVLNLKNREDVEIFHSIARDTALLVKKFRGSLSGEHGDGRLRSEFIPLMLGERNYGLMREIKYTWDPENLFNPGKIIDPEPMNTFLRYRPGQETPEVKTFYDFSDDGGIIRHIEQCNGSGDCRKSVRSGGTMCPSYMATGEEWTSTRARANILREFIGRKGGVNLFDHKEVYAILDLCLSCKACKSECPSSIDMAKLKGEFLQHWYDAHGVPVRTRMIANISGIYKWGSISPGLFNFLVKSKVSSGILKKILRFSPERSLPVLGRITVQRWVSANLPLLNSNLSPGAPEVTLFVDEFTNYTDPEIGIKTIKLLNKLGVRVLVYKSGDSGRALITKGLLRAAGKKAADNIRFFSKVVNEERPLIGIEPSAILSFRDEYPDLAGDLLRKEAIELGKNCLLVEEYIARLMDRKLIDKRLFTGEKKNIRLHGHCQQKAIAGTSETLRILSIPENYTVSEIPSGCCGMAGSFGFEKEHYDLSVRVGELLLFPEVRKAGSDTLIAAPGTSCRHQIQDGTHVKGFHPVEILYNALIDK